MDWGRAGEAVGKGVIGSGSVRFFGARAVRLIGSDSKITWEKLKQKCSKKSLQKCQTIANEKQKLFFSIDFHI